MQEETKTNSINCPVCGNLCSILAVACPKCGHPINQAEQSLQAESRQLLRNTDSNQNSPSVGNALRNVLWVFFAISFLYALGAIRIWNEMPYSAGVYTESRILSGKIAIAYHVAPLIIMIVILALIYSAKERK